MAVLTRTKTIEPDRRRPVATRSLRFAARRLIPAACRSAMTYERLVTVLTGLTIDSVIDVWHGYGFEACNLHSNKGDNKNRK